jgi:hypothetical protein
MSHTVHTTIHISDDQPNAIEAIKYMQSDLDSDHVFDLNKLIAKPEQFNLYRQPLNESLVYFLTDRMKKPLDFKRFDECSASNYSENGAECISCLERWLKHYDKKGVLQESGKKSLPLGLKVAETLDELYESGCAILSAYLAHGVSNIEEWCVQNWGNEWNTFDGTIDGNSIYFASKNESVDSMIDLFAYRFNLTMIAYSMDEGRYEWNHRTYVEGQLTNIEYDDEAIRLQVETAIYGEPDQYENEEC